MVYRFMEKQKRRFNFWALTVNLLITLIIGIVAGIFTTPQIKRWYVYLQKPSFNPPNWIFGPVWTILYILIGISAYLVWMRRNNSFDYINAKRIYFLQLFFNFSWSVVFFGLHQTLAALVIIVLLIISIIINIMAFRKINRIAAWLLTPYLLWVGFATVLNLYIYLLNK